ncbi:MAG: hypothetical protein HY811_09435 [Planctomycetes bacterium]|nr:hypothetical protein [Planctomycetota bacterium]
MLNQQQMIEPLIGLGKTQWDMSMGMWNSFQKNWGQMMNTMIEQGFALQNESMKTMTDWMKKANEASEKLMGQMGENWTRVVCQATNLGGQKNK